MPHSDVEARKILRKVAKDLRELSDEIFDKIRVAVPSDKAKLKSLMGIYNNEIAKLEILTTNPDGVTQHEFNEAMKSVDKKGSSFMDGCKKVGSVVGAGLKTGAWGVATGAVGVVAGAALASDKVFNSDLIFKAETKRNILIGIGALAIFSIIVTGGATFLPMAACIAVVAAPTLLAYSKKGIDGLLGMLATKTKEAGVETLKAATTPLESLPSSGKYDLKNKDSDDATPPPPPLPPA